MHYKVISPVLALTLTLAGCTLPRGAAMESEIIAGSSSETRDIQVVEVTRANVPAVQSWPKPSHANARYSPWLKGGLRSADRNPIAVGDKMMITVWDNEENSLLTSESQKQVTITEMTVAGDGSVFLPYVGKVRVSGNTPDRAREILQTSLSTSSPSAQVQVSVEPGRRHAVDLLGGVGSPGNFSLPDRSYSVLSLISEGGGVSPALENPIVKLVRGGQSYGISVSKLFDTPSLDISLRGGDKVLVEEDPRYFIALGATGKQSTMPFTQDEISALEAVSMLGGIAANRANPKAVLILREYEPAQVRLDGKGPDRSQVVFTVDLTSADGLFSARKFKIEHGDLLLATESPISNTRTVFGLIGQIVGLANQVDSN